MKSLNPAWDLGSFHERIAELAGIADGARVLDLGCGRGAGLQALLSWVGTKGEVVAADRDRRNLAKIGAAHAAEGDSGRLSCVDLDLARPLPFPAGHFDAVVCQNVIECITDRAGLIREMHRILKPGGSALVGHHDFDGVLIASDARDLTRRLVHGYADHVQAWQDASEGQMGRLLPGLFANGPFGEAVTETVLFVDLDLASDSYARIHLDGIVELSSTFGVSSDEARHWLGGLEARSEMGAFSYALPWTYVAARRT